MASENTVNLKRRKSVKQNKTARICVIHNTSLHKYGEVKQFTEISWKRIQDSKELRLQSTIPTERKSNICEQVPEVLNDLHHGYHRPCYQTFTYMRPRKRQAEDEESTSTILPRKRVTLDHHSGTLFDPEICILCRRKKKFVNRKVDVLIKCVTDCAKNSITEAASLKSDYRMISMTESSCLIAQEAHYHKSCQRDYIRKPDRHVGHSHSTEEGSDQKKLEEAHFHAFNYISGYVQKHIIEDSCVERVTMLKEKYLCFMQSHFFDVYNPQYKTYKLKEKLVKKFGNQLQFWRPNFKSELVYSSDVPKGAAIETAFEQASSEERRLQEAALIIRREVLATYRNLSPLPWPPSSAFLLSKQDDIPPLLFIFMRTILTSRKDKVTIRCERLVHSLCQDICYNLTKGQWKTPKHLLLGMSVRHITGSSKVINFLNRLGHCASHSTLLELETAMCDTVNESSSNLPAGATKHADITHFCWDNFDLLEETPNGSGTTHSTHGIIIQEPIGESRPDELIPDIQVAKSKRRSAIHQPTELEPCFINIKVEPSVNVNETNSCYEGDRELKKAFFLWMFCRFKFNSSGDVFPSWKGWVSATAVDKVEKQSLVNYMPPINASVNDLSTVQKILQVSMKATDELGQKFTFVTFDLAVAKKAYDIVWNQPSVYENVVIHLGAFHTMMSYLCAIGKLMAGSGFEEIVVEAGICASGSLDRVLKGRHYNRAMRVHSCMVEALERLLFASFTQIMTSSSQLIRQLLSKVQSLETNLCHDEVDLDSESLNLLFAEYEFFKDQVKSGKYGMTAKFWLGYMEKVWSLIHFSVATKTNNFDLYISSLQKLCPLLFSMNNHNYAKYLSLYYVILLNLPEEAKALMRNKGFSVSRSDVPAGRNAIDLTIEQTINKDAKTSGGIVGFSRSLPAYYRWCVTRHNRSQYVAALQQISNLDSNTFESHKEMVAAEKKMSEKCVRSTVSAFVAFINPFEMSMDGLVSLSSGRKVADDVASDLLNVNEHGEEHFANFVESRLEKKTVQFKHPLAKTKLKTFVSSTKVLSVKSKTKEIQMKVQRNLFGQLLVLSQEHDVNMEKVLTYPLSPTPWSLASPDGLPLKTNKATLLHTLEKRECILTQDVSKQPNTVYVMDGMAFLHSLTDMPNTFGDLAKRFLRSLPHTPSIHFVTDTYIHNSIKSLERERRGGSNNSFILKGPAMKIPANWKGFLSNDENKTALVSFLLMEIQKDEYAPYLLNKMLYYVCEDRCELLTSEDGTTVTSRPIPDLFSSQEEADTRIILHCFFISKQSPNVRIIVRSPDTDVFLLLLSFSDPINKPLVFDTGSGNNRRLINISQLASSMPPRLTDAILGLHAFTGSDTTSCFAGKGKVRPLKLLKKNHRLIDVFSRLGSAEHVCEADQSTLESFVCTIYGKASYDCVDKVRYDKVRQSFKGKKSILSNSEGVDLTQMPPCKQVLSLHIKRSNYQTLVWRRSSLQYPNLPEPENNGWKVTVSGKLEIRWFCNDFLPTDLQEILSMSYNHNEQDEDDDSGMTSSDGDSSLSDESCSDTDDDEINLHCVQ